MAKYKSTPKDNRQLKQNIKETILPTLILTTIYAIYAIIKNAFTLQDTTNVLVNITLFFGATFVILLLLTHTFTMVSNNRRTS
jgi:EamA domain-containing membrane protein RarD